MIIFFLFCLFRKCFLHFFFIFRSSSTGTIKLRYATALSFLICIHTLDTGSTMIGMHNIPSVRFFSTESVDFFNVKCQHWLVVVLYLILLPEARLSTLGKDNKC